MEIFSGVHRIETRLGKRKLFQHIIVGDRILLIDAGVADTPESVIAPYLDGLGVSRRDAIVHVLVTHPDSDHFGGCAAIKRLYRHAQVWVHDADAPLVRDKTRCLAERYDFSRPWGWPLPAEARDRALANMGDAVRIDLVLKAGGRYVVTQNPLRQCQILHLPGHSLGHLAVYLPDERAAIVADAVLGAGVPATDGSMSIPPTYRFLPQYLESIARLETMNLEVLLTSHFDGPAAAEFLASSRRFVERLECELEALLRGTGSWMSLEEICRHLSPRLGAWPETALYYMAWPVTASLNRWIETGRLDWEVRDNIQLVKLGQEPRQG